MARRTWHRPSLGVALRRHSVNNDTLHAACTIRAVALLGVARCAMHVSHAACGVDLLESALTVPYLPSLSGSCEIGFSHSTALPASKHATTCCRTTAPPKRSQPSKAHESGCFHAAAAWKLNVKINLKMRLRYYHERLARTWVLNSQWRRGHDRQLSWVIPTS